MKLIHGVSNKTRPIYPPRFATIGDVSSLPPRFARGTEHAGKDSVFEVILPKPLRRSTLLRSLATALTDWQPPRPAHHSFFLDG